MQLAGLDLNLLVVLDALLAEKSVTRGGRRIHLSQSATSAALNRLRQYFGDELLVPMGHKMVPTPKALELEPQVRDIILRIDTIARNKAVFDPSTASRHFHLMMSDYPATVIMPHVLASVQRAAPAVTFEIHALSRTPAEDLDHGEIDLLILITPSPWVSPGHPCEDLFVDRFVCVVWSENRLVKERIPLEQYLELGHVGVHFEGSPFAVLENWFFEELGQRRRLEVLATSFNLIPHLVVETTRVATMPSLLARQCAKGLPVRIISPPVEIPPLTVAMQWHRSRASDPGSLWLRKALEDAAMTFLPKDMPVAEGR